MKFTDLSSAEFYKDPYPLYRRVRNEGRFVPIAPNAFVTGHYEIIHALLVDRKMGKGYLDGIRVRYGDEGIYQPAFQGGKRGPGAHVQRRHSLLPRRASCNARAGDRVANAIDTASGPTSNEPP
jgi:cytochrome P450